MIVEANAATDVGMKRTTNEDCVYLDEDYRLILVFDGMGGHRAGDVASRLAMEAMTSFYKANWSNSEETKDIFEEYDSHFSYRTNLLRQAALHANNAVLEASLEGEDHVGMGSTVAGMAIHGDSVSVINVGDSRTYRIRDGRIEQISHDHTLAEDQVERGILSRDEAEASQLKHILSSVIGVDGHIRVHLDELSVLPGDIFLLCTDGLTSVMDDEDILSMVLEGEVGPQTLTRMIEEVNERGGPDNTTLAIATFIHDSEDKAG